MREQATIQSAYFGMVRDMPGHKPALTLSLVCDWWSTVVTLVGEKMEDVFYRHNIHDIRELEGMECYVESDGVGVSVVHFVDLVQRTPQKNAQKGEKTQILICIYQ